MAESKHYSKDLTECGICLSTLEEPKALPCLHSYCLKCLTKLAKGKKDKVRCPLCVQDFPLPRDGVKGLRTNFFINTLKERRATAEKLQAKDAVIPCKCCGAVDHKVEAYCTSCRGFVCGECVGIHRKVKPMSSHKLIPFEDLRSGKVDIRSLSQQKFCKIHEGQVLWFYCETCGVLICRDCTVVDHPASSHTLVNMENAIKGQKKEIEQLIPDCEKVKEAVADAFQEVEAVLENLSENAMKTEAQINESFDRYIKQLEEERKSIKSEVNQALSQRRKQLDAQKDEIQLQQIRLHTALQMASEVTNTGSDYDLAVAYTSLKSNLTQLRDMKPTSVQRHLGKMMFKPKEVSEPEFPKLGTLLLGSGVWKFEKEFGKLSNVRGVAVTPAGDIAVAEFTQKGSIHMYDKNGNHKLSFNLTKSGHLRFPWDVVVGSNHQIYVTDSSPYVIVYNDTGKFLYQFTTISPSNVSSDVQSTSHWGLAIDNQEHLLVGLKDQKYISKHQLDGAHITSFKVSIEVYFMAVNKHNKIIIANGHAVQVLDHTGLLLHNLYSPTESDWNPNGLCCPTADEIFISNYRYSVGIYCFSSESGEYLRCITKEVNRPVGLALTDNGERLIVAQDCSVKVFSLQ